MQLQYSYVQGPQGSLRLGLWNQVSLDHLPEQLEAIHSELDQYAGSSLVIYIG